MVIVVYHNCLFTFFAVFIDAIKMAISSPQSFFMLVYCRSSIYPDLLSRLNQ